MEELFKADMVPAIEANVKCPQEVIKFYESHLSLHDGRFGCQCGKELTFLDWP
jgi:hypothetical protein